MPYSSRVPAPSPQPQFGAAAQGAGDWEAAGDGTAAHGFHEERGGRGTREPRPRRGDQAGPPKRERGRAAKGQVEGGRASADPNGLGPAGRPTSRHTPLAQPATDADRADNLAWRKPLVAAGGNTGGATSGLDGDSNYIQTVRHVQQGIARLNKHTGAVRELAQVISSANDEESQNDIQPHLEAAVACATGVQRQLRELAAPTGTSSIERAHRGATLKQLTRAFRDSVRLLNEVTELQVGPLLEHQLLALGWDNSNAARRSTVDGSLDTAEEFRRGVRTPGALSSTASSSRRSSSGGTQLAAARPSRVSSVPGEYTVLGEARGYDAAPVCLRGQPARAAAQGDQLGSGFSAISGSLQQPQLRVPTEGTIDSSAVSFPEQYVHFGAATTPAPFALHPPHRAHGGGRSLKQTPGLSSGAAAFHVCSPEDEFRVRAWKDARHMSDLPHDAAAQVTDSCRGVDPVKPSSFVGKSSSSWAFSFEPSPAPLAGSSQVSDCRSSAFCRAPSRERLAGEAAAGMSAPVESVDLDVALLEERKRGVAALRSDVANIHQLYTELAWFAQQQAEPVDIIEVNMSRAAEDSRRAALELQEAQRLQALAARRKKKFFFFIFVAIVFLSLMAVILHRLKHLVL
eukprot:GHVT01103171.1.p1 GENE.GHVT01103171.1~~GHVT01103171.1.p1  ORF type:complete len:629 (+),score=135.90 GHVT01103171.1:455-2341(+)